MHHAIKIAAISVTCMALMAGTASSVISYPLTKKAVDKHDAELKRARLIFVANEMAADQQLRRELDAATDQAMSDKNLEAVNEATALKSEVDARLARLKNPVTAQSIDAAAQAVPDGRWHVRYYNGENILTIANGVAHNTLSTTHTGKVSVEEGAIVIRWSNGYIDRLTGVGSKVYLMEDWRPADAGRFPDELPSLYGRLDPEK